jgi:hypothetical protein
LAWRCLDGQQLQILYYARTYQLEITDFIAISAGLDRRRHHAEVLVITGE